MTAGVGIDTIEISRVQKACERESFLRGAYTEAERALITERPAAAAGNFAAKEAVAKALGVGFSGCRPNEIEVLRNEQGAPYVTLYGGAARLSRERGIVSWHISISNTKELATAIAVAEAPAQ